MNKNDFNNKKNIDNLNNIRTLNSLYNFLVDGINEFLPIYVILDNQTYSKDSLPSNVISAKIKLHEIESANLNIVNKTQILNLKTTIKNGFQEFVNSSKKNLYTTFYFSEPVHIYKLSSDALIKKLYKFLEISYSEKQNPIVYLRNIQITISDIKNKTKKKTFSEFQKNIINKLSINEPKLENNFDINKITTEYNSSIFKKLDLLYDFLNIPKENCSIRIDKKTSSIFKLINIA